MGLNGQSVAWFGTGHGYWLHLMFRVIELSFLQKFFPIFIKLPLYHLYITLEIEEIGHYRVKDNLLGSKLMLILMFQNEILSKGRLMKCPILPKNYIART